MRRAADGYEIVAGERRWRAAQLAGLKEVPAIIKDFADQEMMEAALIENLQREDLNPVEEARAFERLISHFGITQEALAEAVGKSRVSITNAIRLLRLPSEVLDLVLRDQLSAGHARAILSVENTQSQIELAQQILSKQLSVRETERLAKTWSEASAKPSKSSANGPARLGDDLAHKISEHLMMKVRISAKSNGSGRVEVYYSTLEEFQRFCDQVGFVNE
jgi:ParB family chromosome partitioning protein